MSEPASQSQENKRGGRGSTERAGIVATTWELLGVCQTSLLDGILGLCKTWILLGRGEK